MKPYQKTFTLLCFFLFLVLSAPQLLAEKRVALVIGNADYKEAPLNNPANDAADMSKALKKTGFEVDAYTNIDRKQMRDAIRIFGDKLRQADIGLFYFAGHGIQIKGRNYLIPLAVDVHAADEVQDESIDASAVLRKMESAGNAVNIVILDACRNNPFARSFRSLDRGLARMDGPVGSFIAYATAPGSVAADGSGRNGLYTEQLLKALEQPGLTIEQTFKQVRNGVKNATNGQQIPWESSSLMGEFVFLPTTQGLSVTANSAPPKPPALSYKYLQVIANIPNASVTVNNIHRGLTGSQGALNIQNLTADQAEVIVQAPGYKPLHKKVQLKAGQWEQLYITLEPEQNEISASPPQASNHRNTQTTLAACSQGKRTLLSSHINFEQDQKQQQHDNPSSIQASIMRAFEPYGVVFFDLKGNSHRDLKVLAKKHKLNRLVKARINVRALPITLFKTNMKTINAELTLELIALKNNRVMASVSRSFSKAGLDAKSVVQNQLDKLLPEMSEELVKQNCKEIPDYL